MPRTLEIGDLVEIRPGTPIVGARGMIVGILDGDFYDVVNVNAAGGMAGQADVDCLPGCLLTLI